MELINNRYRVLKYLSQNRIVTSYIVNDINTKHKSIQINILNGEYTGKDLLTFLSTDFIKLCSTSHPNIVQLFNFGTVRTLDNTKVNYPQYYYTCEFFEDNCSLEDIILNNNFEGCLDTFLEIAVALNHFHANGLIYDEIIPENILIHKFENDTENSIIKLRDFAGKEIIRRSSWIDHSSDVFRKAPEIINGEPSSIESDIYSLGVIFYRIMFKDFNSHINIAEKLNNIKNLENADKLLPIMNKMTKLNPEERYRNINSVINDLNKAFGKNRKPFDKCYLEKLNFNVRIAGRVKELECIMSKYNDLISFNNKQKLILVHGESGVGKTRFLNEISHILSIKMANVYTCFGLESTFAQSNEGLIELLRKIIADADNELIYQYGPELVKFIPELSEEKKISPSEPLEGDRERFRLINRLAGFILSCIKNTPTVFIIDNFQQASNLFIDLIDYICVNGKDNNFIFIVSYSDDELSPGTCSEKFINKFCEDPDIIDLKLNCLTSYETSLMIQNILNYYTAPVVFGKKIYSQTYGNPLFIQEVIKNLFEQKILYIDDTSGLWSVGVEEDKNEYEKISIPLTIKQALLQQIEELDTESRKILQVISLFNTPVLLDIIAEFFNDDTDVITLINNLVQHNILNTKIQENGYAYDINSKALKKLIYYQMDDKHRINYHRKAFEILERFFKENLFDNHDELFYQLKQSEDKEKTIVYNMQKAENAWRLKIRYEEIYALKQALSVYPKNNTDIRKLNILKRLASAYYLDGNIKDALSEYKRLKNLSAKTGQYELEIDALNKIANIYIRLQQYKKCPSIIKQVEELLKTADYQEGRLNYMMNLSDTYYRKHNLEKSIQVCKECLHLCKREQYYFKGRLYNMLANMYLDKLDGKTSLRYLHKSFEAYKKANYPEGIAAVLNNFGAVYSDIYQDQNTSLKYFMKMNEFCDKNNAMNNKSLALSNIGATYMEKFDYENALKYFNESVEYCKKTYSESTMFYCLSMMTKLYAFMYDYAHVFPCYIQLENYYNTHTVDTTCRSEYLNTKALFCCIIGDMDSGIKYMDKYLNSDDAYASIDWDNKIIELYMKLYKSKTNSDEIKIITDKILSDIEKCENACNKIDYLLTSSMILHHISQSNLSKEFYLKACRIHLDKNIERLDLKFKYLEGIHSKGIKRLHCLEESFELAHKLNAYEIKIRSLSGIGDYYYMKNNIYYAFNYYLESCSIVKTVVEEIPDEYKVMFVNHYRYDEPLRKLKAIKYKYENKISQENNLCTSISDLEQLRDLLDFGSMDIFLDNKKFIDSSRAIYYNDIDKSLKSEHGVMMSLNTDTMGSLRSLLNYICFYTVAAKGMIIIPDANENYKVIISSTGNMEIPKYASILKEVKAKSSPVIYKGDTLPDVHLNNTSAGYSEIKAVICLPIIMEDNRLTLLFEKDRRKDLDSGKHLLGYIYLETNRLINNFNNKSVEKCFTFTKLIGILLEKYQIKIASNFDKLTGTFTRKYLEDAIIDIIEYAGKKHSEFSLIMMDLDYFKSINDRFGHQTGDSVLKKVCQIVLQNLRSTDICGRYGGEEFIIILPNTSGKDAYLVAEKLRKKIDSENILGNRGSVTVSMGIVSFPEQASLKQELVSKVDQALYAAKESGRNRCVIWKDEFSSKSKSTNNLAGIITGNAVSDYRNVLDIVEIIDLIHKDISVEDKIFSFLGSVIEKTEAQYGFFFKTENYKIIKRFSRKVFEEKWVDSNNYNNKIVNSILYGKQQYVHKIDWDEIKDYDKITGMPDWQSVISIPITYKKELKGILYLTVPTRLKEFTNDEFNFVSKLCELAATFL